MRILLLLRGSPGSGKSTWIKNNNLEGYTLSADSLRLLYRSPVVDKDGKNAISQGVNREVWRTLYDILEYRMSKGEFTVIDACNSKTSEMSVYKDYAEKYRYRIFCVDFTDIPLEQSKKQNLSRIEEKQVNEEVLDLYYTRFKTQKIPSGIKSITRDNFKSEVEFRTIDLNEYNKIKIIGDVHGCYTALKEAVQEIRDDTYYIFVGDYLDRGLENKETLEFLISIKDKNNVCLLEGNHEAFLRGYANDEYVKNQEFVNRTQPQIQDIEKKDIRQFCRKLRQCILFDYNNKQYLVTHGGLSKMPKNLIYTATTDLINGIGSYDDIYDCQKSFEKTSSIVQIYGHRNPEKKETKQGNSYNLEGGVEYGGQLRCLIIDKEGERVQLVQNNVYKKPDPIEEIKKIDIDELDIENFVKLLRNDQKNIQEKAFGNISSFNFTKDAFFSKGWEKSTTKARGLFIDTISNKIVARSYDKFFNINEKKETKLENLTRKLCFPVSCYLKYNGYLGILGYDKTKDRLLFCSKTRFDKEYSEYFEKVFYQKHRQNYEKIKEYIKQNDVSLVFEVIDKDNDPHIIEYTENQIILLDIIDNKIKFYNKPYEELIKVANYLELSVKEKAYQLNSLTEFFEWYNKVIKPDYTYKNEYIEGFVIADSNNFMVKLKCEYYKLWKSLRGIAENVMRVNENGERKGCIEKTSKLSTPEMNLFYGFLKRLCSENYQGKTDIITLRKLFNEKKQQENF